MSPSLPKLLLSMLKVGTIGFGGGSALIPVMEKEFVTDKKWLDEPTFTTHTIVANITPGALPVKLAALAGARLRGPLASVLCALVVALPGAALTVGLMAAIASAAGLSTYIEYAAVGITAFIIVLLFAYIVKVLGTPGQRRIYALIFLVAFLATGLNHTLELIGLLFGQTWDINAPQLNALQLILATIVCVAIYTLIPNKSFKLDSDAAELPDSSANNNAALLFFAVFAVGIGGALLALGVDSWDFLSLIGLSTVTSFGGGEAYVAVADGFFIQTGMVERADYFGQLVPVANALPGPILVKIASGLGFMISAAQSSVLAGLMMAFAAFVLSVSACSALAVAFMAAFDRAARWPFVIALRRFILPVICGLLASTAASMVVANIHIGERADVAAPWVGWATILLVALMWIIHRKVHINDLLLLGIGGLGSLAVFLAVV